MSPAVSQNLKDFTEQQPHACVIVVVSRQQIGCDCCAMLLVHHPEARGAPQQPAMKYFQDMNRRKQRLKR